MFLILWDLMMPSRCKLNVKRQADLLAWKKRYGCADVWKTRWQSHEWDMTWYDSPWLKHGYVFFCWQLWQLHVSSVRHMRSPVWWQAKQLSRVLLTTLQSEWPEWPCGPCTPDISDIAIRVQVGEPQSRWTWIVMILLIYFILLHLFFVLINDFYILMYICGILWQVRTGNWWKSRFKV